MSEIRERKGEKKKRKEREKGKGEKKKRKGKEKERKGERGKSVSFFLISLAFRRSGLVRPRSKVRLHVGIKIEEFHRRSNKENSGNPVYCTSRGRDSSHFSLFSTLRVCPQEAIWPNFEIWESALF